MNFSATENGLTIFLGMKIDSDNAEQVAAELVGIRKEHPEGLATLDAEGLQYISSAGLRSLLKFRKQEPEVYIVNVSPEIYDILDVTGFRRLFQVEKALRNIKPGDYEVIGQSSRGMICRLDRETIVRIYDKNVSLDAVRREQKNDHSALLLGIPAAISYDMVKCADQYGIIYEMTDAVTLAEAIRKQPERRKEFAEKYARFVKEYQSVHVGEEEAESLKRLLHEKADNQSYGRTPEETGFLHRMIDVMPETDTLVHGELFPENIMVQDGELLLLVMSAVITGPAAAENALICRELFRHTEYGDDFRETFFREYTGISDEAEQAEYRKQLGLLYAFLLCIAPTKVQGGERTLQRILREVVIPNSAALNYLLRTIQ